MTDPQWIDTEWCMINQAGKCWARRFGQVTLTISKSEGKPWTYSFGDGGFLFLVGGNRSLEYAKRLAVARLRKMCLQVVEVMIPVMPKFDSEGKPSCLGCPFEFAEFRYDSDLPACSIKRDFSSPDGYNHWPTSNCPIHNLEALEGMNPL